MFDTPTPTTDRSKAVIPLLSDVLWYQAKESFQLVYGLCFYVSYVLSCIVITSLGEEGGDRLAGRLL